MTKKIWITKDLFDKASRCAAVAGYSAAEEFIEHALEKEVSRILVSDGDEELVRQRLQGLGYLN